MDSYRIEFTRSARKELLKLQPFAARRIDEAIRSLAGDPFPPGCRKLEASDGAYRIRIGDYRVIYDVQGNVLVILILRIGHRKDIYR